MKTRVHFGWDMSSKKLAVYYVKDGGFHGHAVFPLAGKEWWQRAGHANLLVTNFLNMFPPYVELHIAAEGMIYRPQAGPKSLMPQAVVHGAFMAACYNMDVASYRMVPPTTWKKEVVGHGGADKQAVSAWLRKSWPTVHRALDGDQDLIDAFCVYRWSVK